MQNRATFSNKSSYTTATTRRRQPVPYFSTDRHNITALVPLLVHVDAKEPDTVQLRKFRNKNSN